MLDAKSAVANLLKRVTVRNVLEARGALGYWEKFGENFYGDRCLYGDGLAYFRSSMRKLLRAATKTAVLPAVDGCVIEHAFTPVRLKIANAVPPSYMPSKVPPIKKSLVAVYFTDERREELNLSEAFTEFEPLIACVERVIDSETFECSWLESQPCQGEVLPDGMPDGYNGRWRHWDPLNDDDPSTTVIQLSDIYAANFKLYPGSQKMCGPLKSILKSALSVFKVHKEDEHDTETIDEMVNQMNMLSM